MSDWLSYLSFGSWIYFGIVAVVLLNVLFTFDDLENEESVVTNFFINCIEEVQDKEVGLGNTWVLKTVWWFYKATLVCKIIIAFIPYLNAAWLLILIALRVYKEYLIYKEDQEDMNDVLHKYYKL